MRAVQEARRQQRICLTSSHVAVPVFHFGTKHERKQKFRTTPPPRNHNMNHASWATVVHHSLMQTTQINPQYTLCFSFTQHKQNKIHSVECVRNIK